MIVGRVDDDGQPIVPLALLGPDDQWLRIEAAIDTGFSDSLRLPVDLIQRLNLNKVGYVDAELGDQSLVRFPLYEALVDWDDSHIVVGVLEGDGNPLVGTRLLRGYEVTIRFQDDGTVQVRRLP